MPITFMPGTKKLMEEEGILPDSLKAAKEPRDRKAIIADMDALTVETQKAADKHARGEITLDEYLEETGKCADRAQVLLAEYSETLVGGQ